MKLSLGVVLLISSFSFASVIAAQKPPGFSMPEPPILVEPLLLQPPSQASFLQTQTQPPPPSVNEAPSDSEDAAATEDRYRTEIRLFAQDERQFVHCRLKNGKVLTGRLDKPGDTKFTIRTNALGDGTSVEYKDLAESPRVVPAVGTRIKQGTQLTGFVVFVVIFFIPLALAGVIPSC
jgi:hypothetical protein